MPVFDPFLLALAALAVDTAIGDPPALYRKVPHPVVLVGRAIEALEARLNDPRHPTPGAWRAAARWCSQ